MRADWIVSTSSSRTAATPASSCAPFSSNARATSGTSPRGARENSSAMSRAIGTFCCRPIGASRITWVAFRVARSPPSVSSAVSRGATISRTATSPTWRAPTEAAAADARPRSPAIDSAVRGGTSRPNPAPQTASASAAQADPTPGSSASTTRPAARSSEPATPPAVGPARRESGRTATAASGSALTTSEPARGPSPQAVTIISTARKSAPTSAPKANTRPRFAQEPHPGRTPALRSQPAHRGGREGDQRQGGHRSLRQEDGAPVEELGEDPAGRRAEHRAERAGQTPPGPTGRDRAGERGHHRERGRQQQRAAEALRCAQGDEHREVVHEAAGQGGDGEDHESGCDQGRGPDPPHHRDQRERNDRDDKVVGRDHERHARDRRVELAVDLRQAEHHDRRVGERERDGRGEQRRAGPAPPPRQHRGAHSTLLDTAEGSMAAAGGRPGRRRFRCG